MRSRPASPRTMSSPASEQMRSSPPRPAILSGPLVPTITSSPGVPKAQAPPGGTRIVAAFVKQSGGAARAGAYAVNVRVRATGAPARIAQRTYLVVGDVLMVFMSLGVSLTGRSAGVGGGSRRRV